MKSYVLTVRTYESCWREIECFPTASTDVLNDGVYIHNTLSWLGSTHDINEPGPFDITFDELVIISLDLGNETYSRLLLPCPLYEFHLGDFYNSKNYIRLFESFLQNYTNNHFSLWQMKEFGDKKSWTQLVNILVPDLFNFDGHVLMFQNQFHFQWFAIFYRGSFTITERPKVPRSMI
ncbi:hypothetical protein CR513_37279, partial [Mucuna pruriens]